MHSETSLALLSSRIQKTTGVSNDIAAAYARAIGDSPELSDDGASVLIRDESGRILDRLPVAVLEEDG